MSEKNTIPLTLALSPAGHLYIKKDDDIQETVTFATAQQLEELFSADYARGLLYLSINKFTEPLPPSFTFWQHFSHIFMETVCQGAPADGVSGPIEAPYPSFAKLNELTSRMPFMIGSEYVDIEAIIQLWNKLYNSLQLELNGFDGDLQKFFAAHNSSWNLVGRIYFHLAENKNDPKMPFAFLITYTTRVSANQTLKHMPLKHALEEYGGPSNKKKLLALLLPIQKAAVQSVFLKNLVSLNQIFTTRIWTAREAHEFLKEVHIFEQAGITVRIPNWWNVQKPPRPQVTVSIGETKSFVGLNGMLDFNINLSLSTGETLTEKEWGDLLSSKERLVKIKGQWVEVDQDKLQDALSHWKEVQRQVSQNGLTFAEGMRLMAGSFSKSGADNETSNEHTASWSSIHAGQKLKDTLQSLRNPEQSQNENDQTILNKYLHATLRPYQVGGVSWLKLLYTLKLGGCLADDMGLGKTIQVISLLLLVKHQYPRKGPHLLVVPASLLGNWNAEIKRFAPSLSPFFMHPSMNVIKPNQTTSIFDSYDLVITTYNVLHRSPLLSEVHWDIVLLDEAQVIKNPNTQQTQSAKKIQSNVRFVLTGTPIENSLSDLWSLFDFFAPGLLGSLKQFGNYSKAKEEKQEKFFGALRALTSPYILRRLKSDKKIISDLPDKTEVNAFCTLSKQQITLYQQAVEELTILLENEKQGIKRRGIVLSYLMRFKQLCNHPSQWLGYGDYNPSESGKFLRLKEICQEIAAKQEKVLIFTQFQEIIPALSSYLATLFKREGLVLHGDIPIKKRAELVKQFADEQGPPFFVLSLKAGGSGLNLTNASHVIHFDRWWNPAVENQATDRAYRIGQKKNVMVYKFFCQGTIEEKIDQLIASKQSLTKNVLQDGCQSMLTEMSNEELLNIIKLDIHRAIQED